MVSRMRILSSPSVVEHADKTMRMIVDTYFSPNRTLRELREAMSSDRMDPMREFSDACREDLRRS
jgi:hypothetical protein